MANIQKVQETKLFSAQASDATFLKSLRAGSMSNQDAASRKNEYEKLFSKYENLKEAYKMFSGVSEMPLLSNQYFNATVASFVRSFAGFLSIERDMAEPTALLWFDDVLGVVNDRMILPNIGEEHLNEVTQSTRDFSGTTTDATVNVSSTVKVIPGSVKGTVAKTSGADPFNFVDDAHGNLLAPASMLTAGTIDYATGQISFTVPAGYVGGNWTVTVVNDEPGIPGYGTVANDQKNRFKLDMKNILVKSEADMLIGDSNLVAVAQANKSLGQNPMQVLGAKLVEMYTKIINNNLVAAVKKAASSDPTPYEIDARNWPTQFYDFNSRLNAFSAAMVDIDTALAAQSVKGVEATAYVVGKNMANWFRKMRTTGEFVEEKGSTYVNDLLGTYHGIPVLRHIGLDPNEGYAVHKTAGGELAPVMFGSYLPLTWTPNIGNYSNPTQVANGVFYQNGVQPICSELVKKFTIVEA